MNIPYRAVVVAVMVMILMANPVLLASGNPVPGRWEKVAATKSGTTITVQMKNGNEQKYRYQSVDDEFLNCLSDYGSVQIDLADIEKVDLYKRVKYMQLGTLFGLLGGAAVGGVSINGDKREGAVLVVPVLAGVGAVAGLLIGGLAGNGETIYISKEAALAKAQTE